MTITADSVTQLREENERKLREIVQREGKSPQELYAEREKRILDAVELREPDRVPVTMGGGYFAARYAGFTASVAYYEPAAFKEAIKKTALDFEPDASWGAAATGGSGVAMELLDAKQTAWPGGPLPPDVGHQFIEGEYMKEDEYDLFLNDPTDFTLRYYLPRTFGALAPLASLPPLMAMGGVGATAMVMLFLRPEFKKLGETLVKAAEAQLKYFQEIGSLQAEMAAIGFPPVIRAGGMGLAPFDAVSDMYRGMRGSMLDMYRRPEKLLAACDKIFGMRHLRMMSTTAGMPLLPDMPGMRGMPDLEGEGGVRTVFMPLHRGAQGFMSKKQFETFYWPGLKATILDAIDRGFIASPFFEGYFDDRLEYLLELPKGKVICHFENTNMARAKEILGDRFCLMGNVPSSLLQCGSPTEVEDYCKDLIRNCGKGGGFILTHGSSIDEAKPANLHAMVDSVKKYGWY